MSKGSKPRKVNKKKYDSEFDRIFNKCPACNSGEVDDCHVGPDHYLGETFYKRCGDCDFQWDHR